MSLGLTLYLMALPRAPRAAAPSALPAPRPPRPKGPLIWIEAGMPDCSPSAVLALARSLCAQRPDLTVLLRLAPDTPALPLAPDLRLICTYDALPRPRAVARFCNHWRPDAVVGCTSLLEPALLAVVNRRAIPLLLAGLRAPEIATPRLPPTTDGWMQRVVRWSAPGVTRALLAPARHVLATDDGAARALQRAGARPDTITITGPLEEPSHHTRANEAERSALARSFGTRRTWVALGLPESEEDLIAQAHLGALRIAHRLLLILVPADPSRGAALQAHLTDHHGLTVARRSAEEDPDETTQVYLADTEGEAALWLRLAPIVWMGGTASGLPGLVHPLAATSHGAALIHGDRPGDHGAIYQRLHHGAASRIARSDTAITDAVEALMSPAEAAALASAAWNIASLGTQTTARVLELVAKIVPASRS